MKKFDKKYEHLFDTRIVEYKRFEKRRKIAIATVIASLSIFTAGNYIYNNRDSESRLLSPVECSIMVSPEYKSTEEPEEVTTVETVTEITEAPVLTQNEVDLLALVTMAEAEGESELGKRLVIDTILNRVDNPRFPNTIHGVVYQPNQFECMWNGRTSRCYVREDIRQLVLEELETRTNSEVVFFRAGGYSQYGTPLFQEGNHYFSKY
jgi:N-acetylmuramoyl-L-alanine amidase